MSTHLIFEAGQGLPDVGELVYEGASGQVYEIESIDSGILTRQWAANHVRATLISYGSAGDLDDDEWEVIRNLRIETLPEGAE